MCKSCTKKLGYKLLIPAYKKIILASNPNGLLVLNLIDLGPDFQIEHHKISCGSFWKFTVLISKLSEICAFFFSAAYSSLYVQGGWEFQV